MVKLFSVLLTRKHRDAVTMKCLQLGVVILILAQTSLGIHPKSDKLKLTSYPTRSHRSEENFNGYPGTKSRVDYAHGPESDSVAKTEKTFDHRPFEHEPEKAFDHRPFEHEPEKAKGYRLDSYHGDEPRYGMHHSNVSRDAEGEDHSDSNRPFPRTPAFYGPIGGLPDSESSYIPHSKSFSKYFGTKPGFRNNLDDIKDFYAGEKEEPDHVPRYGYRKQPKDEKHDGIGKVEEYKKHLHSGELEKRYPFEHKPKLSSISTDKDIHSDGHDARPETGLNDVHKGVIRNYGAPDIPAIFGEKSIEGPYERKPGNIPSPYFEKIPLHLTPPIIYPSYIPKEFHPKHADRDYLEDSLANQHDPKKPRHKEGKDQIFRTGYPFVQKYRQKEQSKSFRYLQPDLKFDYGYLLQPKERFYEDLKKDLDMKMRLLKEHEEKTSELQKQHLEKYRALFKPQERSLGERDSKN